MRLPRRPLVASLLFVSLALVLGACETSGVSKPRSYSTNYAGSLALRKLPPPHERGIKTIALVYRSYDKGLIVLETNQASRTSAAFGVIGLLVGAAIDAANREEYEADADSMFRQSYFAERFYEEMKAAPYVKAYKLTAQDGITADALNDSKGFYEERRFDGTAREQLAALKAKGVDAILVVDEQEEIVYGGAAGSLPAKGIYFFDDAGSAVAGFRFSLIDTATGEEFEDSGFVQGSMDEVDLSRAAPLESYSDWERQRIRAALEVRVASNVRVMLELLKVVPGEDGNFLSFDPYEKPPASDYRE